MLLELGQELQLGREQAALQEQVQVLGPEQLQEQVLAEQLEQLQLQVLGLAEQLLELG